MQLARAARRTTFTPRQTANHFTRRSACTLRGFRSQRFFTSSSIRFQENKDAEKEAEVSSEEVSSEEAAPSEVELQLAECQKKLEESEAKLAQTHDKMLRNLAEMENVRQRAKKDVDNAKNFALQGFAKKMLDTTDNLGWALDASREAAEKGDNAELKTLFDGVVLTETTLLSSLKSVGVEKFASLGEKFDPNMHDGLFQFEDPTKESGTVGQVMKEGYTYNGRVIRPANVGTVKAPAAPAE